MILKPIPIDRITSEWDSLTASLYPALRQDPTFNVQSLYDRLMIGYAWIIEATEGAEGYWVISLDMDGDDLVAWTTALVGRIEGGPKQRLKAMREGVEYIEGILRKAGVAAHRICGRQGWSMILPHYLPYDGAKNGIERRL
jgi:hypothetical protein